MLDAIRDGLVNKTEAEIPAALGERSAHLKAFGYFNDAAMVGICALRTRRASSRRCATPASIDSRTICEPVRPARWPPAST